VVDSSPLIVGQTNLLGARAYLFGNSTAGLVPDLCFVMSVGHDPAERVQAVPVEPVTVTTSEGSRQ
jgi:hypothetical protein